MIMEFTDCVGPSERRLLLADTCGPCHDDAACTHGCKGSVTHMMPARGDVTEYKNPEVILRIEDHLGCSKHQAETLFEEMKQYLVSTRARTGSRSPSKNVDVAWHEFILFTRDYAEFCDEYLGCFVHHVPTPRLVPNGPQLKGHTETAFN